MGVAYKTVSYSETTISTQGYIQYLTKTNKKKLNEFHKFLDNVKKIIDSTSYPDRYNYQLNVIIEHDLLCDPTGEDCYDDWFLYLKLYKVNISQHNWVIHHTVRGINLLCEYEDKTDFCVEQLGAEFGGMSILDIPKLIVLNYREILAFIEGCPVGVACPLDIISSPATGTTVKLSNPPF